MAQSKRIRFISFLQILGVILVILGHSLHEYPGDFHQFWFYRMFQTVRMPLFVFISGYLFMISMVKREYNVSLVDFIKNKAQRLLVPYFVLTILTFVPRALMSEYADEPVNMDINSFISSIFFSDKLTIVFLWFLPVVFVLLCVSFIGIKLFKNRLSLFFLIGGILSIAGYFCVNQWEWTFMGVGRTAKLAVFLMCGIAYGRWKPDIDFLLGQWWFGGICAAIWCTLFYTENLSGIYGLVCSLSGLAMLITLAIIACEWQLGWRHLEGYNYMMYLLSWFTCVVSQQILHHFTDFPWWIYTIIALLSSIYIPWSIGKMLHRYSASSRSARSILWLLGHNPNKSSV